MLYFSNTYIFDIFYNEIWRQSCKKQPSHMFLSLLIDNIILYDYYIMIYSIITLFNVYYLYESTFYLYII